jgi:catechol 2,3-dioxygenase-like lactoylglutathione lyase family enzyme
VEYGLEVVVLPVSDADKARDFYRGLGWRLDVARVAGPLPGHKSYGSFVSFEDPDGNGWLVQEITTRLPGR